jgi:hypothetical protein
MKITNSRLGAYYSCLQKLLPPTNLLESDRILGQYVINVSTTVVGGAEAREINYYVHSIKERE